MQSSLLEVIPEIVGWIALERYTLAGARMREAQHHRMQHHARRFDLRALVVADVDALADQRMAELGQVNPDLVLASGLEAALDECCALQSSDGRHDGDRAPRIAGQLAPRPAEVAVRGAQ